MAPERPSPEENTGTAIAHVFTLNSIPFQLKEGDGAMLEEQSRGEDDDLTSLSWLVQNKNLLKGINLKPAAAQTSPTSDFAEDGSSGSDRSERGDSTCSSGIDPNGNTPLVDEKLLAKLKHPHHIPYDPLIHINSKPPYSFSCLIFMAIEDSPARALPVKEIYAWIQSHFPFYRNAPTGWKNSVRHNLSLNKCFCKVEKAPNLGKGSLWMVDPAFRPNLLQSMSKAPVNSLSFLDRSTANIVSSGSDMKPNGNLLKSMVNNKAGGKLSNLPNPELFPFLSRRLAASGVDLPGMSRQSGVNGMDVESEDDEDADDVDAAAAMLTLKHGPRVILPKNDELYKRMYSRHGTRKSSITAPVITSSPSEDHTYSAGPNMSPDEAYGEGSDTDDGTEITPDHLSFPDESMQSDTEEQRRIAEGAADALLNLAGFRSKQNSPLEPPRPRQRCPRILSGSSAKRARRQRLPSSSIDTPRPQQLRSNRKRERMALEQEMLDRRSVMKAEIMADLEVIRNNNNIVCDEEFSKGAAAVSVASSHSRPHKLKEKRKSLSSSKQFVHSNHVTRMESGSVRHMLDKKNNGSQMRKHWSQGENSVRKGRR